MMFFAFRVEPGQALLTHGGIVGKKGFLEPLLRVSISTRTVNSWLIFKLYICLHPDWYDS